MRRWFLTALLCFSFVGGWLLYKRYAPKSGDPSAPVAQPSQDHEFFRSIRPGCPSEIRTLKMEDPFLRGILEQGAAFQAAMNYYQCNSPVKGDLVLYRYSWKFMPVARQIVAVGGDKIALRKVGSGWELWINGKVHLGGKQRFVFGIPSADPPLQNYFKANKGTVLPNHVLVLSSFPPGDKDSSVFGAVDIQDIVGKISF